MAETPPAHPYRVGIVGTGGIARAHGFACQSLEGVELAAICDVSEAALNRYGDAFGVAQRYLDLDDMLAAEDLDIAIICTWGTAHAATSVQIARSQRVRAILCEKPFAANASEAAQMVAVAQEHDILLTEAFKFRHHPMHLKAKELVDSGVLGKVMAVRSTFLASVAADARKPERNWRFNRAKGGGSINDLGCYGIHHARWLFDAEPVRVFAAAQRGLEVDDGAAIVLVFPGDRTAQISIGYNAWRAQYAEVSGTKGMLRLDKVWNNENQPVTLEHYTGDGVEAIRFGPLHQFTYQLRHLCECLETGQPPRIRPESSINQMQVIDAVFDSVATGKVTAI